MKQPKLCALSEGGPSPVLETPSEQAPRTHPLDGGVRIRVGAVGVAAAGCGDRVEGCAEVAVVRQGDIAGNAGGAGDEIFRAGGVGGRNDGEDITGLCGEFDVSRVREVDAIISRRGDNDGSGLGGSVGYAIENGFEARAFAGVQVDEGAEGEIDDVGVLGDGLFDALDDPAEEAAGLTGGALRGDVGGGAGGVRKTLEDFDVEQGGGGGYADQQAGAGADGSGGERGGPGTVTLLVLRTAVVAWTGQAGDGGLVDFGEVEGEVGRDVGVVAVHAAVEDRDAHAGAEGLVPGTVRWTSPDAGAVSACLNDGPALWRSGVVAVIGDDCDGGRDGNWRRVWRRRLGGCRGGRSADSG